MGFFDLFRKKESEVELMQRIIEAKKHGRPNEAADCARKLAEMGDAKGMYVYATYFRDGKGVQKDMQQCMAWLQKSADAGYAPAQEALTICKNNEAVLQLKQALELKKCGKYTEAVSCFRRAAEMGDARAMFSYAMYLKDGEGVQQDIQESLVWLQKSADTGYAPAQTLMAKRYYSGIGVEKDIKKAFALMKQAAESGNVSAQRELALMHLDGALYGNETMEALGANVAEALEWFEKAGNQGDAEAQYQMGFLLGMGADGDRELMKKSYEWLAKAADQGHQKAIKMCEDILAIFGEE